MNDPPENSSSTTLREEIRREALSAGFDRAGFARAEPSHHAAHFHEWLARGYAGTMEYLSRNPQRRVDPREVLQGAHTVIALAIHYGEADAAGRSCRSLEEARALAESGRGEISRYARGTDYHRIIEARLVRLCRSLGERHHPHRFRYHVDTGPVLERAWAEAAGIGWVGKNSSAIDPLRGSYFFIGVIISTMEIPPDQISTNHCGSCSLCIDACPTGAIVRPYQIDARRCISYLTIENRREIPVEYGPLMGGLVFGCDICQEVCPFNRPEHLHGDVELQARTENIRPALEELAGMSREDFSRRFPRSAVKRAKATGFLRNVMTAASNGGPKISQTILAQLDGRKDVEEDPVLQKTRERLEN